MRKWALFLLVMGTFLTCVRPSIADDTDLFTLAVKPEALILLDMSGSMNWDIAGNAASSPNRRIDIARDVIYDLLDDDDSGRNSNHDGSYINSDDERSLNVKIGYMRFRGVGAADEDDNNPMTGRILVFDDVTEIGSAYNSIWSKVSDPAETATGCTPLGASLVEAGIYFRDHVNPNDEAVECRQKFVVFVTDGSDTVACNGDCSENASDMFKRRFITVLRAKELYTPTPGPNVVPLQVFAIGFGANMPDNLKKTLNWVSKYGGTDNPLEPNSGNANAYNITQYVPSSAEELCNITDTNADPANYNLAGYAFLAEDASQLREALKTIIRYIQERSYSYTAPSVPTVRMMEGDVVYISSFMPNQTPFWRGNLKAYRLRADGTLPVDADGNPLNESVIWDAAEALNQKAHDQRRIHTYVNGALTSFEYDHLTNVQLGVATDAERSDVINHFRGGMDAYDVNRNGNRTEMRDWKLGDVFHSSAVIVGEPSRFFIDQCFNRCPDGTEGFYQRNRNRTKVIIVGANDGMLHAFNAETGAEEWAFVPNSLLGSLKNNATLHTYYVDSSPKVTDVWFYSDSNPSGTTKARDEWKTVLISGLRKGGKHYFALDITDTLNPTYLWEFPKATDPMTLAKLGQSWSDPAIGRIRMRVGNEIVPYERWVAFIGGGFDQTNVTGKAFFVIDIKTGDILAEFSGLPEMDYSMTAPPTAVDTDFNGYIDKVYIGDLSGQMWVFDTSSVNITDWTGRRLFRPAGAPSLREPVYYQPAVSLDNHRTPWVFFGTGDRENPTDTNSRNNFYAVKDNGIGDYPRRPVQLRNVTNFTNQTFTTPQEPLKGWYIELARSEKVLSKPAVFSNLLYFTTYTYPSEDECNRTGEASLYVVEYLSGGGALVLDDYVAGRPSTRSETIGEGIPSAPVISVNLEGKASVTIGTTSGEILTRSGYSPSTTKEILYWREVTP
jgi:Tfp pilus tip-associated adhesin PilY1